jgi:hypothetical protein
MGQLLFWHDTAEGHVGPVVIVSPQPTRGKVLHPWCLPCKRNSLHYLNLHDMVVDSFKGPSIALAVAVDQVVGTPAHQQCHVENSTARQRPTRHIAK